MRVVAHVLSGVLLFAPQISKDDIKRENFISFLNGERNGEDLSSIKKNIYWSFVIGLCNSYISVALQKDNYLWNRELYTQIISLLNRPIIDFVITQTTKRANSQNKHIYYAFVSSFEHYLNYYIFYFNDAIRKAYGKDVTAAWCFAVHQHLQKYKTFVENQNTEEPLLINDRKVFIKQVDKNLDGYKKLQKFIQHFNNVCKAEEL